ncbi:Hypothetical protein CulFRC58_0104 [Corynebacterium ulcerans FRC58]|uniref:Transposase n=1 Tax=Corynebacterium ulcerans FRC58 TaxID=1408268 RepID=A0ABM5TY14_CORUL|nr:Hypothetical protein CulFRC58_0104 [Corynebacterium ulcerans FRC58]
MKSAVEAFSALSGLVNHEILAEENWRAHRYCHISPQSDRTLRI